MSKKLAARVVISTPMHEPDQRRDDRQTHRDHRAEHHQQDHHRHRDADQLGAARRFLLGHRNDLPAGLDLEAGRRRGHRSDRPAPRRCRSRARWPLRRTARSRRRELPSCEIAPGLSYGETTASTSGQGRGLGEDRLDLRADGRVVHAGVGSDDDLGAIAGLAGETLGKEIDRLLGFDAGDGKGIDERAAGSGDDPGQDDERGDPAAEHAPAVADGKRCPALERAGPGFWIWKLTGPR